MPLDIEESLLARLPTAIQTALQDDAHSPLQQWLSSTCYDAYTLLRYASTHTASDAYAMVLAAAAATAIDAANAQQPMDETFAGPLWRSVTEGQVPPELVVDADESSLPPDLPANVARSSLAGMHAALGLTRTFTINNETREFVFQQAIEYPDPINTALSWFYLDLDIKSGGKASTFARKYLTQWVRAHDDDPDLSIILLRRYLDSARLVGVAGALPPIESYTEPTLSPSEAAWAIAWDEAARAGSHEVCSELAIRRALSMPPTTATYRRWLFIHGLHEERRGERHITGDAVRRELLDLIYDGAEPSIPASLCGSIAARTNRLEPVLREVLPYLPGPTTPLIRSALDAAHNREDFHELQEQGTAGALLALRILRSQPDAFASDAKADVSRRTPPRDAILDDYESNEDFMREIFSSEDKLHPEAPTPEGLTPVPNAPSASIVPPPKQPAGSIEPAPSTTSGAPPRSAASDDVDKSPTEPHQEALRSDEAASAAENVASSSPQDTKDPKDEQVSVGPFDQSIFATLPTEKLSDTALVAAQNDVEPTVSDVLLAAFLPTALRRRADQLLAQRISSTQLEERSFIRAIEERIELLPDSAWVIAELLVQQDADTDAKSWMKRAAKHTPSGGPVRAERYRRLAQHCAQRLHDLSQAIHFLEKSLSSAPCDPETIALLDTIYTRIGRTAALIDIYQRALRDSDVDASIRAQWQLRLEEIEDKEEDN